MPTFFGFAEIGDGRSEIEGMAKTGQLVGANAFGVNPWPFSRETDVEIQACEEVG
jgi:hypothetical protein